MFDKFLDTLTAFKNKNEPFAVAIVVRREAPSSGKTGDKAIIDKYGEITGWAGGGCIKAIMIKEAEKAIKTGKSTMVRIGPSSSQHEQEGIIEYKMTCQSEGAVDIFIEPVLPAPHLVVIGKSAIAQALVRLGKFAGYRVTAIAPEARVNTFEKVDELITQLSLSTVRLNPLSCIVVATQGEQDEEALQMVLQQRTAYIGFVASKKKRDTVFDYLYQCGFDKNTIALIHSPAGIDIKAKQPEEVAISILAEIIQTVNQAPPGPGFTQFDAAREEAGKPKFYINPVCGVPVDVNHPRHILEYKGEKVYFCCDGCKIKFEKDPEKYMTKAG